jgi:hypothetical protein
MIIILSTCQEAEEDAESIIADLNVEPEEDQDELSIGTYVEGCGFQCEAILPYSLLTALTCLLSSTILPLGPHPTILPYSPILPYNPHSTILPYSHHPTISPYNPHSTILPYNPHPTILPYNAHPTILPYSPHFSGDTDIPVQTQETSL